MAKNKKEKTLADYVVIAISPVLIMTLVGSLAFFLMELSYHGQYEIRLKWILFWFVSASVLVARIGIEQGKDHARLFGFALTAAVGLAAVQLVDTFLVAWLLMAVSWWCTWKLTWDCTLIDDSEDASGEGLLQAAGLNSAGKPPDATNDRESGQTVSELAQRIKVQRAGKADDRRTDPSSGKMETATSDPGTDVDREPNKPPVHVPGKWVVYFSLAALPLFGAGQLFIPASDREGRAYGFGLLAVYVASALGLLLTTSFLGLRRYLRQRKLQMPASMTRAWLGMGMALALALLCLALLLPQPQGEYTVTALVDKLDAKLRNASRFAVVHGDRAKGEGRRIGDRDPKADKAGNAPQKDKPADQNEKGGEQQDQGDQQQNGAGGKADAKGQGRGEKQADGKGQEQKGGQNDGDRKQPGQGKQNQPADQQQAAAQPPKEQPAHGKSPPSPPTSSGSMLTGLLQTLAASFKWLVYGALALVAVFYAVRHWSQFRDMLARLWAELLSLFGLRQKQEQAAGAVAMPVPAAEVRFAAFEDPFFSGAARRMSPAQLVRYTFEALEAWSREQVVARPPEQTPLEFAQELARRVPALAGDVTSTAELYVRVAYARKTPSREAVEVLERLWRRMGMGTGVE